MTQKKYSERRREERKKQRGKRDEHKYIKQRKESGELKNRPRSNPALPDSAPEAQELPRGKV
jgi:hypothetical protein